LATLSIFAGQHWLISKLANQHIYFMKPLTKEKPFSFLNVTIIVAALGYFVDIYDLLLFSIIRKPSIASFGLQKEAADAAGEYILQIQMLGLLVGGIIWGILGDKKGRLSVLFGSILLYSVANIFNGFVTTVNQYAWIRFVAGLGLAGELGAGITLVSEMTPKEKRGIATSLVAGIGILGAVAAFLISQKVKDWRTCYFIGGGLGFLLLLLRISIFESGMFNEVKKLDVQRGNFLMLFTSFDRFKRYIFTIFIGLPTWFVIGILVTFSDKFANEFHIFEKVVPGKSVMFAYIGLSISDLLAGFISNFMESRKKALYFFYGITILATIAFFLLLKNSTAGAMYTACFVLGFGSGFWALFVTLGAEQFGTNLRATTATTVPNMVRGFLAILVIPFFQLIRSHSNYVTGGWVTGAVFILLGLVSIYFTKETFGKDLDFLEE
jgi:MFS family permease